MATKRKHGSSWSYIDIVKRLPESDIRVRKFDLAPSSCFCLVHRHVRTFQDFIQVVLTGEEGDADAGAALVFHRDIAAIFECEQVRGRQGGKNFFGDDGGLPG